MSAMGDGAAAAAQRPGSGRGPEPIRVLIADDHALFRRGLEMVLEEEDDIDLGTVAKSAIIDPAVADAAFALKAGEISAPVQSQFGAVLVTVAILAVLGRAGGNYTEAAKLLGVHPNYLHRLVRNLDLKDELQKATDR